MNRQELQKKIRRFILTQFRETARDLGLKESHTAYVSWGKGPKRPLRFSKSGNIHTERRYSTHYVKSSKPESADPNPTVGNP
ncbi:hypothetical protein [Paenibacillus sp. J2TS4]|uniref:hypothetical protein n=1 Tax=Paenibacillus sp. J2TS4 TaxID=2807194 RepID=UPI001B188051|nr:hypothetical protein [Paenibacillus sp. J2TS4]GIP34221.1 hypothetical protein J2TS4_34310 [Paenibacillus sp. J2TS4]